MTSLSQHERRVASLARIPSLDGLRTLSIFLVVALHTLQRYSLQHPVALPWYALFNGGLGVSIFFVISGYLITSLLLKEHRARGRISLGGFFLKRAFRILPPILAYVGVLALLAAAGRLSLSGYDVLSALFFFRDYAPHATAWALEHFWSLSVEEQFYLLWPPVLIVCLRRGHGQGSLLAGKVVLAMLCVVPLLRGLSFVSHNPYLHNPGAFHMRADTLMFGCAAALLEGRTRFERLYRAATRLPWLPPAALLAASYLEMRFQNVWNGTVGLTITGFFITVFLLWCVRNAGSAFGRVLNAPPVVHLGVLSYSIYLWQTLFLHHFNGPVFAPLPWLGSPPANWLGILLLAELSYLAVEQPALRLRTRLLRRSAMYSRAVQPKQNLGRDSLDPLAPAKAVD